MGRAPTYSTLQITHSRCQKAAVFIHVHATEFDLRKIEKERYIWWSDFEKKEMINQVIRGTQESNIY